MKIILVIFLGLALLLSLIIIGRIRVETFLRDGLVALKIKFYFISYKITVPLAKAQRLSEQLYAEAEQVLKAIKKGALDTVDGGVSKERAPQKSDPYIDKPLKKRDNIKSKPPKQAQDEGSEHGQEDEISFVSKLLSDAKVVLALVKEVLPKVYKGLVQKIVIDVISAKVRFSTGDAASTAVAYGGLSMTLGSFVSGLSRIFYIRYHNVEITPVSGEKTLDAEIRFNASVRIFYILITGISLLRIYLRERKKRKAGTGLAVSK